MKNGYVIVGQERKPMHVLIAERAIGREFPPGAQVHHVNGVKHDNRPENLVVCPSQQYHALLHVRQKALDACGNANLRRCWFCGGYDDPKTMAPTGSQFRHRSCYNEYQRKALIAKRAIKEIS